MRGLSTFHRQGYLSLDQSAPSPVQTGLEYFQGWDIYYLSGQSKFLNRALEDLRVKCSQAPGGQGWQGADRDLPIEDGWETQEWSAVWVTRIKGGGEVAGEPRVQGGWRMARDLGVKGS